LKKKCFKESFHSQVMAMVIKLKIFFFVLCAAHYYYQHQKAAQTFFESALKVVFLATLIKIMLNCVNLFLINPREHTFLNIFNFD
jgi:hypothetical protein